MTDPGFKTGLFSQGIASPEEILELRHPIQRDREGH